MTVRGPRYGAVLMDGSGTVTQVVDELLTVLNAPSSC